MSDQPSHLRDAVGLIEAGRQELAFVPRARAVARRGGPPFEASLHLHIAIGYAQAARRSLAAAAKEIAR